MVLIHLERKIFSVPEGEKWPFSALRENICSRMTFNQSARRKVLFVPHSKPRIYPQTSKFPWAKPSAILRFSWKTPFLNSGTKLLIFVSVPQGKKWPFSALREKFCSRITFNQSAGRKVLFVPYSKPRIFPQTSKFLRARPSAILRFSWKTSFLNIYYCSLR